MRWNRFSSSLVFAAVAGLSAVPSLAVLGPWLGVTGAAIAYVLLAAAVYVTGAAPSWAAGVRASLLAVLLGAAAFVAAGRVAEAAVAAAGIVALCRGVLLYRRGAGRTLARELILGAAGLAAAALVVGPTPLRLGAAVWVYLLVQSTFFLIGAAREREAPRGELDPFESARARAADILEQSELRHMGGE